MLDKLEQLSARKLSTFIYQGKISSREITEYFLSRIEKCNLDINAFITVSEDSAINQAKLVDKRITEGEKLSRLAGVPIAIKDNINVDGLPATCGSKILANHISIYNATVVERLKKSGLVIIGKTNMDEFAMGSSNEHSFYGAVKNPRDMSKVPGGSSGGSAAAVASGMTPLALGSDTAGSVRQPASFCGIVGLRPSYGRVSRYGLIAFASSFDQVGPMARDVEDTVSLTSIISGYDSRDSTSVDCLMDDYSNVMEPKVNKIKIGIPREYLNTGLDDDIKKAIENIIKLCTGSGIEIIDISLPSPEHCLATYYILANSEASSNLARYDGVRYGHRAVNTDTLEQMYLNSRSEGFGDEVKRRLMLGTYALSAGYYDKYYRRACKARKLIADKINTVFEKCDLILTPTSPTTAFKLEEKRDDPLAMYLADIYMTLAPLAGLPAISIPIGNDSSGMPIGLQLIGPYLDEATVFRCAYHIERLLYA